MLRLIATTGLLMTVAVPSLEAGMLRSRVTNESGEPLVGVTVVATGPVLDSASAVITEVGGLAFQELPSGLYQVAFYYVDRQVIRSNVVVGEGTTELTIEITAEHGGIACPAYPSRIFINVVETSCGASFERLRPALPRVLPSIGIARGTEVRHRGLVLGDADLLPDTAIDELERTDIGALATTSAAAAGTLRVKPLSGTNGSHGTLRALAGSRGLSAEATLGGPIRADRAWYSASLGQRLLGEGRETAAAATASYSPHYEHQGGILAASKFSPQLVRGLAIANWRSRFDDGKTELNFSIGSARSARSMRAVAKGSEAATSKSGARVSLIQQGKLAGNHELVFALEGYRGERGPPAERHTAAAAVGDLWRVLPNLAFEVGLRAERTPLATTEFMPRVGVVYDYTKEGRSRLYSHWGRYLDTESQSAVLASTGLEYEIIEDVAIRVGLTRRRGRNGGDVQARSRMRWLRGAIHYRYERGPATHRIDSSLEVRLLDCPCSELWLGAIVREGGDVGETRGSGLALSWQLRNQLSIGLEATRTGERGYDGALQLDWGW